MKFINLCPHPIRVMGADGNVQTFPSQGVARCATSQATLPEMAGFRVVETTLGAVTGLPECQPGTVYIVSGLVLSAVKALRADVVGPDTGPTQVRLPNGQTDYVMGFTR